MAQANTIIYLVSLDLRGDGNMGEFLNRWDKVLGSIFMAFDVKKDKEKNVTLRDILIPQMEKNSVLRGHCALLPPADRRETSNV